MQVRAIKRVFVAGWVLYPASVIALASSSWRFCLAYACVWVMARAFFCAKDRALARQGILSVDTLRRQHGGVEGAREFVRNLAERPFIEPDELPWARSVEARFDEVRAEVLACISETGDSFENAYDNAFMRSGDHWKAKSLIGWGLETTTDLPRTRSLMREIGAINCTISRLAPHSKIELHDGETNAYVRCHLPISVPGPLPQAGMEVGGERRPWMEGQLLAFNDLHHHGAFNNTANGRVVVIFDVMRSGREKYAASVCCRWLVAYSLLFLAHSLRKSSGPRYRKRLRRGWGRLFTYVAQPPLELGLWVYFRFFCGRPPLWLRHLEGTAFYF
jgi:hypothetical protein